MRTEPNNSTDCNIMFQDASIIFLFQLATLLLVLCRYHREEHVSNSKRFEGREMPSDPLIYCWLLPLVLCSRLIINVFAFHSFCTIFLSTIFPTRQAATLSDLGQSCQYISFLSKYTIGFSLQWPEQKHAINTYTFLQVSRFFKVQGSWQFDEEYWKYFF